MDSQSATLKKLKEQAELNSVKKLQSLFNTSDQLEQIQQHLNRIEKKKNIVEAQLKSGIQSHFISVNSCMVQLKDVNKNLENVRTTIYSIEDEYKTISHLETTLHELRQEAYRHKQLKSAKENMKNILDVEELAKKAHQHLEKNELLFAHKYLLELEKCRNDILMELGDPTATNVDDIKLVEEFFKDIKDIQKLLQSQIFVTIDRMLTVVRKDPKQLVTALRIIEREEILDEDWRKKHEDIHFMPADRPKKWKDRCLDQIKKYIDNRIQGSRYKERNDDTSWLTKQFVNASELLVKDLEVVKKLCEPCFPPAYKIFDYFVDTVHNSLSSHLVELLDTNFLEGKEFFVILMFQDNYKSKTFMGHTSLKIDTSKLKDLLDDTHYTICLNKHIQFIEQRIPVWMNNALDKNAGEWTSLDKPPSVDFDGNYESKMPNDIISMITQELELINHVNDERFSKATLKFLIAQLFTFFENKLKDKLIDFRNTHFKNTDLLKDSFVKRLVTIANDLIKIGDYVLSMRTKFEKFIDKDEIGTLNDEYQNLYKKLYALSFMCIDFIIEDMSTVLSPNFKLLLNREWLTNENIIQIIICTTNDYLEDIIHFKPDLSTVAMNKWHNKIKFEYIKGFLQNLSSKFTKFTCSDPKERVDFTNKVLREVKKLEEFFKPDKADTEKISMFDFAILDLMNRVVKTDDVDFIGVEIGALVKKAPEMTNDMLYALLSLRGDISKSDFKESYEGYIVDEKKIQANIASGKYKPDEALLMFKREFKL